MVQLSATRCSFAAVTLCVASQQAIPKVSIYFIINSVQKLLNTPLYSQNICSALAWQYRSYISPVNHSKSVKVFRKCTVKVNNYFATSCPS